MELIMALNALIPASYWVAAIDDNNHILKCYCASSVVPLSQPAIETCWSGRNTTVITGTRPSLWFRYEDVFQTLYRIYHIKLQFHQCGISVWLACRIRKITERRWREDEEGELTQPLSARSFLRLCMYVCVLCVWSIGGCVELNSVHRSRGHTAPWSGLTDHNTGYVLRPSTASQPPPWTWSLQTDS